MPSPWVQRTLAAQRANNRACLRKADATLGDRVAADKLPTVIVDTASPAVPEGEPLAATTRFLADRDAEHPTNIPGTNVPACSSKCRCT